MRAEWYRYKAEQHGRWALGWMQTQTSDVIKFTATDITEAMVEDLAREAFHFARMTIEQEVLQGLRQAGL